MRTVAIQVKKCPVRDRSKNVFTALAERTALLAARFFIIDGLKNCVNTHKTQPAQAEVRTRVPDPVKDVPPGNITACRISLEKFQNPFKRNVAPVRTVVDLIGKLIESLSEQAGLQQSGIGISRWESPCPCHFLMIFLQKKKG